MAENADGAAPDAAQAQLFSNELAYTIEMVRTFLDWRHNVLTRFAVASAALGAAAYVADSKKADAWSLAACLAGVVLAATALCLDLRNAEMLRRGVKRAAHLEDRLNGREADAPIEEESFFRAWSTDFRGRRLVTYRTMLQVVYGLALVGFVGLAFL